jgi:hypothetical protein
VITTKEFPVQRSSERMATLLLCFSTGKPNCYYYFYYKSIITCSKFTRFLRVCAATENCVFHGILSGRTEANDSRIDRGAALHRRHVIRIEIIIKHSTFTARYSV